MKLIVKKDYDEMSKAAADIFISEIKSNPSIILGLATGSSPIGLYKELIAANREGIIDFGLIKTFNLDEYAGLDPEHEQSYAHFMKTELFNHVNINKNNYQVPSGVAEDMVAFCKEYDEAIENAGGIDVQLLGLGENGHIAFNEPAKVQKVNTNVVSLTDETIEVNSRFFEKKEDVPKKAITMGIGSIMKAKKIVLIANGKKKAEAVKKLLTTEYIDPYFPASFLLAHNDLTIIVDEEAASQC